ncbi:hypothetical protein OG897_16435 [Streptomyces sp. NBC_00237]|nr:hypothetical protein [Streptomyces sp. NBC_00237]
MLTLRRVLMVGQRAAPAARYGPLAGTRAPLPDGPGGAGGA